MHCPKNDKFTDNPQTAAPYTTHDVSPKHSSSSVYYHNPEATTTHIGSTGFITKVKPTGSSSSSSSKSCSTSTTSTDAEPTYTSSTSTDAEPTYPSSTTSSEHYEPTYAAEEPTHTGYYRW